MKLSVGIQPSFYNVFKKAYNKADQGPILIIGYLLR